MKVGLEMMEALWMTLRPLWSGMDGEAPCLQVISKTYEWYIGQQLETLSTGTQDLK